MIAIMGIGPRVGTGFVMGQAGNAGLPIYYDWWLDFPDSTYDTIHYPAGNYIAKVWPGTTGVRVDSAIVLRREREAQIESINKQIALEIEAGWSSDRFTAEQLIDKSDELYQQYDFPRWEFRTEDLDETIPDILEILRTEIKRCQLQ